MTPLPDSSLVPAPFWLLTALHLLTLTLHFVAMNFLLGGILVVFAGRFRSRAENPAVRRFVRLLPALMAATITLGVAPLLFLQLVYGRQVYSSSIVSAWFWVLVPLVAMAAYFLLHGATSAGSKALRTGVLAAALVGLVYVSVVYSSVFSMAEKPVLQATLYKQSTAGIVFNSSLALWLPRWIHALLGAVTVGGFLFGWLGRDNEEAYAAGRKAFTAGFALASVAGVVYLATLGGRLTPFMHSAGIWTLVAGLLLGLCALPLYWRRRFGSAALLLFFSLFAMVATRHVLRLVSLQGDFDPGALRIRPQWSVFIVFVVCFVAALGVAVWMLRLFFRERAAPGG